MSGSSIRAGTSTPGPHEPEDVVDLLGFRIFRLSNSMGRLAEAQAREQVGFGLAEYRCLTVLATQSEATVTSICAMTHIDKGWVSRTLQRLVDGGYAAASDDRADAWRGIYRPTAAGHRAARTLLRLARERQRALLSGLSDTEASTLMSLLETVQRNAEALDGQS